MKSEQLQPLRVLYVHHALGLGGAPLSLRNLVRSLSESVDAMVLMPAPKDGARSPGEELLASSGAVIRRSRGVRSFDGVVPSPIVGLRHRLGCYLGFATTFLSTVQAIRAHRPDVLHVNTFVLPGAALAGRLLRVPTFVHVRETSANNVDSRLLTLLNQIAAPTFIGIDREAIRSFGLPSDSPVIRNCAVDPGTDALNERLSVLESRGGPEQFVVLTACLFTTANGDSRVPTFIVRARARPIEVPLSDSWHQLKRSSERIRIRVYRASLTARLRRVD